MINKLRVQINENKMKKLKLEIQRNKLREGRDREMGKLGVLVGELERVGRQGEKEGLEEEGLRMGEDLYQGIEEKDCKISYPELQYLLSNYPEQYKQKYLPKQKNSWNPLQFFNTLTSTLLQTDTQLSYLLTQKSTTQT